MRHGQPLAPRTKKNLTSFSSPPPPNTRFPDLHSCRLSSTPISNSRFTDSHVTFLTSFQIPDIPIFRRGVFLTPSSLMPNPRIPDSLISRRPYDGYCHFPIPRFPDRLKTFLTNPRFPDFLISRRADYLMLPSTLPNCRIPDGLLLICIIRGTPEKPNSRFPDFPTVL